MNYPIEIEIDEPHAKVIDELLTEMEHCVMNIRDRWKRTDDRIVHTADLDEILADKQSIGFVWDTQHVKDQRPDLRDEQAWEALKYCRQDQQCFDRLNDVMREMIGDAADKLYPQQRQARSSKAAEVIAGYGEGDEGENLADLLTDARHWCDQQGEDFASFDRIAHQHYLAELNPIEGGKS